jgi:hypothetical protein
LRELIGPTPTPPPEWEGLVKLKNEVKISILKRINIRFRKFICITGIAPPSWGRGWGGAIFS